MDMSKDHFSQVALLGFTFMVTGAVTDSIYAILAGRARKILLGAADAAGVADIRRFYDRRRHLAGADTGAVRILSTARQGELESHLVWFGWPHVGLPPRLDRAD